MFSRISRNGIEAGTVSWSKLAWLIIAFVSFWHLFAVRLNGDNWKYVINSDGAGYYAYLPATFIYHDPNFGFAEENSPVYQSYRACDVHFFGNKTMEGKRVNKYFIGTAILELPFFIVAWTLSSVFGYPAGGYSFLYQAFIAFAGIFYLLAGLFCIRKLLLKMEFRDTHVMLVLCVLFFGTNLYHYALEEPSMSHIYSFGIVAFFLLNTFNISREYSRKRLILFILSLTLIVLIRPTNGIILLLVPFFLKKNEAGSLFRKIISDRIGIISGIVIAFVFIFFQLLSWKLSGGHWLEDAYVGENLSFLHPHLTDVLFSWRKGFFIYAPLMLLSVAGLLFIRPVSRALILSGFIFINIWIISSWHDWSYGGSFGMRPFVDTYAVFAIPLAFFIRGIRPIFFRWSISFIAAFFIFLNLFQVYQYHNAILPFEYMGWKKYKRIFLHHEKIFAGIFAPENENAGLLSKNCRLISTFTRNYDHDTLSFFNQAGIVYGQHSFSPPGSVFLHDTVNICPDLFVPINKAFPDSSNKKRWIELKAKVWLEEDATDAKMVISFKDDKNGYEWNGFYIVHRVDKMKSWQDYQIVIQLPEIHSNTEVVSAYALKGDNKIMYLDNMQLSFWEEK